MTNQFFKFLIFYILLFQFSENKAQNNSLKLDYLGIEHGLSQSTIITSLQDKKGFLWFGTQDGLNRFDGYNFKVFASDFENSPYNLTTGRIINLIEDIYGNIVISTSDNGFDIYDPKTEIFHHKKHITGNKNSIAGTLVYTVFPDARNNYWIFHNQGFSKMTFPIKGNLDSVKVENFDRFFGFTINEFINRVIQGLAVDSARNMYFLRDNKLYFVKNTEFNPEVSVQKLKIIPFLSSDDEVKRKIFGFDREQNVWIMYPDKIEKIVDISKNKRETFSLPKLEYFPANNFYVSSEKIAYFASPSEGIFCLNLKTNEQFPIKNEKGNSKSLISNIVYALLEDRKGTIWFGTSNGISKYNPHKNNFIHIDPRPDNLQWLQDPWVFAFAEDKYKNIWIGTMNGKGIYIFNKKTGKYRLLSPAKSTPDFIQGSNYILKIFKDSKGEMWIGTARGGFGHYNENTDKFNFFTNNPSDSTSIAANFISDIAEDKDGNLWLTNLRCLDKFDRKTQKFTHYWIAGNEAEKQNDVGNPTQCITIDKQNTIWTGSLGGGLTKITFTKENKPVYKRFVQNLKNANSISLNHIFNIAIDKNGILWISTAGGGINRFDPKTEVFKKYTLKDGLPNNTFYGILPDNFGRIWASSNCGVLCMNTQNGQIKNYTVNHGLQSNEFNQGAFFIDSEGLFYFGGINGYNVFSPSEFQIDTTSSEVIFTDFKIFNKSVIPGKKQAIQKSISYCDTVILKYWQTDFSFEFTSNNFGVSSENRYAYMIEGYHDKWIELGKNHSISFTGFPHGEYVLKIKAANADDIWGKKISTIVLIIQPPFWKTKLFYALVTVFILLCIAFYIRFRTRKLMKDKEILEKKVVERTAKIEAQKNEILEKNEELNQLNEEIRTQRDNLQELNNELFSKNEEITAQNSEIAKKNKNITASITYASRIQKAILPKKAILSKYFPENFILYKPRDIVSGDFYFIKEINDILIIAAADCTGHGVPGAFMSMLGITVLNEIIRDFSVKTTATLLDELRSYIKTALHQKVNDTEIPDGMDIAVCAINLKTLELQYSGANNPLWIIKPESKELVVYKSDKQPIGIYPKEKPFNFNVIQLEKGDQFYIFSDGYESQFGGKDGDKLKSKRFQEIILQNATKPINEQFYSVENEFNMWKGERWEQVDDVLVIGVKIT